MGFTLRRNEGLMLLLGLTLMILPAKADRHNVTNFDELTTGGKVSVAVTNFGNWSDWGECSRSCGGGISRSVRPCFGGGCSSSKINRHRICNRQECPDADSGFRAQQCAFYDNIPYRGVLHKWVPDDRQRPQRPCALYCRNKTNGDVAALMSPHVLDGTKCYEDSNDICINGTCQEVGCDGELESSSKFDVCGKCRGDGSTCRLVTGLYRPNPRKHHGAEEVITIPQNSRHVTISERGTGHAGLKIDGQESDFLVPGKVLNASWNVFKTSGLVVQRGSLSYGKEYFDVPGPVPRDLKIMALYDENEWKYIRYEFYRPLQYVWKHDAARSHCTVTCGKGVQFIRPVCVNIFSGELSDNKHCKREGLVAPAPRVIRCKIEDCPLVRLATKRPPREYEHSGFRLRWLEDPWTICSKSCAEGIQTRTLSCALETYTGAVHLTVDQNACLAERIKKPESRRKCNEHPCPRWTAMPWSSCNVPCGHGRQYRVVQCQTHNGRAGFGCSQNTKPIRWKSCSAGRDCTTRVQPKIVLVKPVEEIRKPVLRQAPAHRVVEVSSISIRPSWFSHSWGDCSTTCGAGVTSRLVQCMVFLRFSGVTEVVSDSECQEEKPISEQPCSMGACEEPQPEVVLDSTYYDPDYANYPENDVIEPLQIEYNPGDFEWRYTDDRLCPVSCGNGTIISTQRCFHITNNTLVARELCDGSQRTPDLPRPCNTQPCSVAPYSGNETRWHIGQYRDCNVTCGRGIQNRSVICRKRPEGFDYDDANKGLGEPMPDIMCPAPKPPSQRVCSQLSCDPHWETLRWGKCSRPCGRGVQRRKAICRQKLGRGDVVKVNYRFCPPDQRPHMTKPCTVRSCGPRYYVKKWPPCRKTCGKEVVHRTFFCGLVRPRASYPRTVNHRHCSNQRLPLTRKSCNLPKCVSNILKAEEPFYQTSPAPKVRFNVGSEAYVLPGTIVVIRCKVQKYWRNQIQWLFQGVEIDFDDIRYHHVKDGSLRIDHVTPMDSGAYTCIVGPSRADSFVLVTPENTDENFPLEQPGFDEEDFLLLANATSDPDGIDVPVLPFVSIGPKRDAVRPVDDEISLSKQKPVAIIERFNDTAEFLDQIDYGVYSSPFTGFQETLKTDPPGHLPKVDDALHSEKTFEQIAPNESFMIISRLNHSLPRINSPPTTSPEQHGSDVTAYVGGDLIVGGAESVTIFCEASGNPQPVITWFREDVRLPEHLKRQYILADDSLRIYHPEVGDSGSYTCVASNPHGNTTATTSLMVTLAPRILSTTEPLVDLTSDVVEVTVGSSITARLGAKVLIRCPTIAHPKAYVVWLKDSPGLRLNSRTLSDNTLEIFPTTEADQGLFGCEATNPSGSDYQASSLTLIDPPHISESLNVAPDNDEMTGNLPELLLTHPVTNSYRVKAYSSVMMGCPVTGFPLPSIVWSFNGVPLVELGPTLDYQLMRQDRILQIPEANMDSEGVYECTASNEGGNLTTSLQLALIEYSYQLGDFNECTATCGGRGTRYRRLLCIEDGSKEVDEWFCTGLAKPVPVLEPCNQVDCPPRFVTGTWEVCSVTCGDGTRSRATSCVIEMSDGSSREVSAEECLADQAMPNNTVPCHAGPCPIWKTGPWRHCSKRCAGKGVGRRNRRIFCAAANGTRLGDKKACKGQPRPPRKELCPNKKCEPMWVFSHWSVCSQSCGKSGIKTRVLSCVFSGRRRQPAGKLCPKKRRPNVSVPCNRYPCKKAGFPCVDRSRKCAFIKRMSLCPRYWHSCCKTCR